MEKSRIERLVSYIDDNLGDRLTVGGLAKLSCRSESTFNRDFRAHTGTSVWSFVKTRRCGRAMVLLRTTDLPICEIALICGFSSQAHLTAAMKDEFKKTPAKFRRVLRRQQR